MSDERKDYCKYCGSFCRESDGVLSPIIGNELLLNILDAFEDKHCHNLKNGYFLVPDKEFKTMRSNLSKIIRAAQTLKPLLKPTEIKAKP